MKRMSVCRRPRRRGGTRERTSNRTRVIRSDLGCTTWRTGAIVADGSCVRKRAGRSSPYRGRLRLHAAAATTVSVSVNTSGIRLSSSRPRRFDDGSARLGCSRDVDMTEEERRGGWCTCGRRRWQRECGTWRTVEICLLAFFAFGGSESQSQSVALSC